ncbi:DUF4407 domain-containing protein [Fulvivirga sediminis]|uniref:DUF4407 domain-containing protein n=1 Tax=Fulvivirga sediminis TaxID=2803949 RepID=A0A937K0V8_9BACT|nr:DUF4407 domain-containing protein [Fulvivirga sediminis]MBL3656695.1 DUF4407 domain-containing protein [Fulvivirga sediminis]
MNKLKMFFWHCSGANIKLLEKCPTDSTKYVGVGATIFFTGLFAALAGGYALFTITANPWWSVAFGLIWGLMILNLDRYVVSSMRKKGKPFKEFMLATPRIILALLISLVIAKPLEMKIFENEIKGELSVMEQELFARQEGQVASRFTSQRQLLVSEINELKGEILAKENRRNELRRIAQQEADGTGGTGKRNPGPIYQIKKENADRVDAELQELSTQNNALIAQKSKELMALDAEMKGDMHELEQSKLDGPAARMEALDRLTSESDAIYMANLFIILLFIAIETAPIFVKLISGRGPYDHLLSVEEHSFFLQKTEVMAAANSSVKERSTKLADMEKEFVQKQLDVSLDNQ